MNFFLYIAIVLIGFSNKAETRPSAVPEAHVLAKITTTTEGNKVTITATAIHKTQKDLSITYTLSVEKNKNRKGNKSNNTQRGRAVLKGDKTKILSSTTVNKSHNDVVYISLCIYSKNGTLLSEDTTIIE